MIERIRELRRVLGLSQRDFAAKIGVTNGTVGAWETGRSAPTIPKIYQICQAFNVRRGWLENGEGEMFEKKPDGAMTEDEKSERLLLAEFRRLTPTSQDALLRFVIQLAEDPRYRG